MLRIRSTSLHIYVLVLPYQLLNSSSLKKVFNIFIHSINLIFDILGGRIIIFSSYVNTTGFGAIVVRDDPKIYNTDKEKVLLSPANDTYIKLAQECVT